MDAHSVGFGVDIGGTGIKVAPVDLATGVLTAPRVRVLTPRPSTPRAVSAAVAAAVAETGWAAGFGACFPAVMKNGVARTAANVDRSWIGTDVNAVLSAASGGVPVSTINDADAAGLAEVRFGAGRDVAGTVIMLTFGTGIGSGVFVDGRLVPNTELGHLEVDGHDAETRASEIVREREKLTWEQWAKRVNKYLTALHAVIWPDLIIIGGGSSRKADKFLHLVDVRCPVVPALLRNDAGIVGAAVAGA